MCAAADAPTIGDIRALIRHLPRLAFGVAALSSVGTTGFWVGQRFGHRTAMAEQRAAVTGLEAELSGLRQEATALRAQLVRLDAVRGDLQERLIGDRRAPDKPAVFVTPEMDGRRVDHCLDADPESCGAAAAHVFCRLGGFSQAAEFTTVEGAFSTVSVRDHSPRCGAQDGAACVAFELIVCQ